MVPYIGGGSRGGAPRHIQLPRPTPPLGVPEEYGGAHRRLPRHLRQCAAFQQDARKTPINAVRVAGSLAGPCPTAVPCPQMHCRGGEEEVLIGLRVFCLR